MGYVYDSTLAPKYRMQFADAAALVTSLESDKQYLCQAFESGPHGQDYSLKLVNVMCLV